MLLVYNVKRQMQALLFSHVRVNDTPDNCSGQANTLAQVIP